MPEEFRLFYEQRIHWSWSVGGLEDVVGCHGTLYALKRR